MASPYAQFEHRVRLEWGPVGAAETAPDSTYAVVVDVLSFTTTLSVAMDIGAEVLPITLEHALLAGSMSWAHRDPFDRLLVAQATVEDATFVTVDAAIVGIPVPRILTW